MFKHKQKKSGLSVVKNTLATGGKTMANSMKYAADLGYQIGKNSNLVFLKESLQKRPASGIMVAAGIGLTIFGIFKFIKK